MAISVSGLAGLHRPAREGQMRRRMVHRDGISSHGLSGVPQWRRPPHQLHFRFTDLVAISCFASPFDKEGPKGNLNGTLVLAQSAQSSFRVASTLVENVTARIIPAGLHSASTPDF